MISPPESPPMESPTLDSPVDEMSARKRRELLATAPNPGERHDYMVVLEGSFTLEGSDQRVNAALRYVADRRVLPLDAFGAYLESLNGGAWPSLEAVALVMLGDVNNELIPRWVQIRLVAGTGDLGDLGKRHSVIIEDRQPGWDDPTLLARHGAS